MSTVRMMLLTLVFSSAVSLVGCKPEEGTRAESSDEAALPSQDRPRQESSPPPGAVALAGTLDFEGRPIYELTPVEPTFSLNNVDTGERGIRPEMEYDKGRFEIRDLPPGDYIMFVSIDANPDNPGGFPGYPGDFFLPTKAARVSVPGGIKGVRYNFRGGFFLYGLGAWCTIVPMSRPERITLGGYVYHVLNRGIKGVRYNFRCGFFL